MSSAGQKPRKGYFVGEVLKWLDVRYSTLFPLFLAPYLFASFRETTYSRTALSLFSTKLYSCSVNYTYEN